MSDTLKINDPLSQQLITVEVPKTICTIPQKLALRYINVKKIAPCPTR